MRSQGNLAGSLFRLIASQVKKVDFLQFFFGFVTYCVIKKKTHIPKVLISTPSRKISLGVEVEI